MSYPGGDPRSRDYTTPLDISGGKKILGEPTPAQKEPVVTFVFNPTTPEEWRANVAPLIQLYASQILSNEEVRERLGLGPKDEGDEFAPDPTQLTPGQANKITTNPRTSAGLKNPKGVTDKPPEQQEKPKERKWKVALDTSNENEMTVTESRD